jgi:Flp pilus assembly protein TadG
MFLVGEDGIAGAALVEFTLFAPLLVIASIYTMDFGLLFYNKMEMQNVAQAGAQWAIANRVYNCSSIWTAAQNATRRSSVNLTTRQFCGCSVDSSGNAVVTTVVTPSNFCTCTPSTGCTHTSASDSAAACTSAAPNATCPSGNGVQGNYVTVTATPTTTYNSFVPHGLISSTYDISATTTARLQ